MSELTVRQQYKKDLVRNLYKEKYGEGLREEIILDSIKAKTGYTERTILMYLGSRKRLRDEVTGGPRKPKKKSRARKPSAKEKIYEKYPVLLRKLEVAEKDPPHIRLAKKMHETWIKMFPEALTITNAKVKRWAEDCRLMREADGRAYKDIYSLFLFTVNDKRFWSSTVTSPGGLRNNYDKILIAQKEQEDNTTGTITKQDNYIGPEE